MRRTVQFGLYSIRRPCHRYFPSRLSFPTGRTEALAPHTTNLHPTVQTHQAALSSTIRYSLYSSHPVTSPKASAFSDYCSGGLEVRNHTSTRPHHYDYTQAITAVRATESYPPTVRVRGGESWHLGNRCLVCWRERSRLFHLYVNHRLLEG